MVLFCGSILNFESNSFFFCGSSFFIFSRSIPVKSNVNFVSGEPCALYVTFTVVVYGKNVKMLIYLIVFPIRTASQM
jgi:hypothetical protein